VSDVKRDNVRYLNADHLYEREAWVATLTRTLELYDRSTFAGTLVYRVGFPHLALGGQPSTATIEAVAKFTVAMRLVSNDLLPGALDVFRQCFAAGHKPALMRAINDCAEHGVPLPEWASEAYQKAFNTVQGARVKSWDDVFGRPHPKGAHLAAIRKRQRLWYMVRGAVLEIRREHPETVIDEALFERVGKQFNIGKTLAAEIYYRKSISGII
jgi:hypothetical protein